MNRRPLVTGIVMAAILWLLVWPLTGSVIISLIVAVVMSFASTLIRRSKYGQRNFAKWADKHPYPSS